jgi:hypothetical protein
MDATFFLADVLLPIWSQTLVAAGTLKMMAFSRCYRQMFSSSNQSTYLYKSANIQLDLTNDRTRITSSCNLIDWHVDLQMALKILDENGKLNHEQLDFFLKGNLSLEKSDRKNPYTWFPETGWHDLMRLITLGKGREDYRSEIWDVADDIERDEISWKAYFDLDAPEAAPLPNGFSNRLTAFEKLLVLRCVKMDRVTV